MMLPEATPPHTAKLTPRRPRQQVASEDSKDGMTPTMDKLSPDDTDSSSPKITSAPSKEEKALHMKGNVNNCIPEERRKMIEKQLHTVQKRLPGAKKMMDIVNLLPPRVRVVLVSMWLLWKVVLAVMFLQVVLFTTTQFSESTSSQDVTTTTTRRFAREIDSSHSPGFSTTPRILYVVTTLAEFNNGLRQTVRGQDRLGEVLIPILVDSVESMVHPPFNFHVDVYIIAAFELKPEREEYIRQRLPDGVGLEVWDDACRKSFPFFVWI
jgi:hypothetical protein